MNIDEVNTNRFDSFDNSGDEIYYGEDKVITTPAIKTNINKNGLGYLYFYSMKKFSDNVAQVRF